MATPVRPRYGLRLYVAGMTPRSARALANIKQICEEHLKGRYALHVIDIYQQPVLAKGAEAIVVCDEQGRVIRASQAVPRLCDGSPLLRPFAEVFPLRTDASDLFGLAWVLQGETLRNVDVALDRQGRKLDLILSAGPLLSGRQILGCVITLTDITDRKRAARKLTEALAQLARSNKELESFAYSASHDLKGPLITITGFLGKLVQDTEHGDAKRMESDIARIGDAARKMDRLLHDLLELSRIGHVAGSLEDVSLAELAREVANLLAGPIAEGRVRIDISSDLPTVHGERARLTQLLMNLLGNAVKFVRDQPDPQVEIEMRRDGEETVCYVRNNGIGIEPQHKDRIFGLFQQLNPSRGGTGIGLCIV